MDCFYGGFFGSESESEDESFLGELIYKIHCLSLISEVLSSLNFCVLIRPCFFSTTLNSH